jgi:hypothetical protein
MSESTSCTDGHTSSGFQNCTGGRRRHFSLSISSSLLPLSTPFTYPPPPLPERIPGIDSGSLCNLAGRYDNPISTRFLASIECSKNPTQNSLDAPYGTSIRILILFLKLFLSSQIQTSQIITYTEKSQVKIPTNCMSFCPDSKHTQNNSLNNIFEKLIQSIFLN